VTVQTFDLRVHKEASIHGRNGSEASALHCGIVLHTYRQM